MRDPSHTYTFAANDDGRNASAALNGATAGAYLYNAFEQRAQKTVGSTATQFVFDRFGHLLAEANGSGSMQKEYIWLDDVPVAVVDDTGASPVLYFIHGDQLGTPQKITDASATVIWDGTFDPFGNAQFVSGAGVWNTSTWNNFTWGADLSLANLRFPGQYADAETALNQNWFRDYDPTIGRYIQSDPAGVLTETNTYGYVSENPISFRDPTGEVVGVDDLIEIGLLATLMGGAIYESQQPVVHGNSYSSQRQTCVYQLLDKCTRDVLKYGITSSVPPQRRYTVAFYAATNSEMEVIACFPNRLMARTVELGLTGSYAIQNGTFPPLTKSW